MTLLGQSTLFELRLRLNYLILRDFSTTRKQTKIFHQRVLTAALSGALAPARGSGALAHRGLSRHVANGRTLGPDRGRAEDVPETPLALIERE